MKRWIAPALAGALALASCGGSAPAAAEGAAAKSTKAVPAGFCPEHGVPEAVCTKCIPALAAVFQARGDWCAEHGFPLSVCPTCNPGAAAALLADADLSADEAPADGTKVLFKTSQVTRIAGIETVQAVERRVGREVRAPAVVTYDASRIARVNPRAAGVMREVRVQVGSRVQPGTPLAVIESAAVGADRSRLLAVRARAEVAEAHYRREEALHEKGISARKEVLEARRDWEEARAEVAAAEAALAAVEAGDTRAADGGLGTGSYTLTAPQAGVVTERNVSVGQFVHGEEVLFEIVDTATVWVEIDVKEADLAAVRPGQAAVMTFDALGERKFRGTIDYVAPRVDPRTRSAKARVVLPNPDGVLRANLYGEARIRVTARKDAVVVPREAVQQARGATLVFVRLAENEYETRRVEAGPADAEGLLVALADGVAVGEDVVTTGSFLLKTETLKDAIGAGCCEVE
jgi:cobalt-zinc-cadmium efflux system membrane fusion protein